MSTKQVASGVINTASTIMNPGKDFGLAVLKTIAKEIWRRMPESPVYASELFIDDETEGRMSYPGKDAELGLNKCCKNMNEGEVRACVESVSADWNGREYRYFENNCIDFAHNAMKRCCLTGPMPAFDIAYLKYYIAQDVMYRMAMKTIYSKNKKRAASALRKLQRFVESLQGN